MQEFYKKALVGAILLLLANALLACFCIYQSYPSTSLMPQEQGGVRWHVAPFSDAPNGDSSTIRILDSHQQSLRFDFRLSRASPDPRLSAALVMDDANGKAAAADLSRYSTVTFVAKCTPANSLMFSIAVFDEKVTQPDQLLTYPPAETYFSCNEKGVPISLDLTRLTIPQWWYEAVNVDLSHQSYKLDRVAKIEFGASDQSPRHLDSHVEISELTLHGRDDRYIVALAAMTVMSWSAFGVWLFRAHARALVGSLDSKLKKDMPLVAYRQLTQEPFEDEDKAAILRFIATNYMNPDLDLDAVVAATRTTRNKINDVLKAELGMTFTGYVNKLRLTEAGRLLAVEARATVAEIAYSVGYANVSYFNKLFKDEYGYTPKSFRSLATRQEVRSEGGVGWNA